MKKKKTSTYFWTSYADLMTSLFFIMMVLFAVAVCQLSNKREEAEEAKRVAEAEMKKIREIEAAIEGIDPRYFQYNDTFKKHILKIDVHFDKGSFVIPTDKYEDLIAAGRSIQEFMTVENKKNPEVKYLLVIEGQASKDSYVYNDVLSYQRAGALRNLWRKHNIHFGDECEVVISGSGIGGVMRDTVNETKNQRLWIHIMPKPGIIENLENN